MIIIFNMEIHVRRIQDPTSISLSPVSLYVTIHITKASKCHLHRTRMGEQGRMDMEVCQDRQRIFMKL
jgi:hypothetical protein